MKVLFTSDLHGNMRQFFLLFERASRLRADVVLIGGDIAPRGTPQTQKRFVEERMVPLVERYTSKNDFRLMLIPGNDDWASCFYALEKYDGKLFDVFLLKPVRMGNLNFIGYPFVPITPFRMKDWEKWDRNEGEVKFVSLKGLRDLGGRMVEFTFEKGDRSNTIENDMKRLSKLSEPGRTVYVFHSPPFGLFDKTYANIRVGSMAIRRFIEEEQPLLTLHGHVHEGVDTEGKYKERVGKSVCASSGNFGERNGIAILVFETENAWEIRREIVI